MAHKGSDVSIQHDLFYFFQFSLVPTVWVLALQTWFHSFFVMQADVGKIKMSHLMPETKETFLFVHFDIPPVVSDDSSLCIKFCSFGV